MKDQNVYLSNKKSFVLYHDTSEVLLEMTDEDAGKVIKDLIYYSIKSTGQNPKKAKKPTGLIGLLEFVAHPFKAHIDRDLESWKQKATRNQENGKKGGRPKKVATKKPKKAVNVNVNGTVNVKGKVKDINEIIDFCLSIDLPKSDAEYLYHMWEGNGYTKNKGKEKIKDWKATIRSWKAGGFLPSQKNQGDKKADTPVISYQDNRRLFTGQQ